MKTKKFSKKGAKTQLSASQCIIQAVPALKIHFDFSPKKMACFIDDKKPRPKFISKTQQKVTNCQLTDANTGLSMGERLRSQSLNVYANPRQAHLLEEEQIVQGTTNDILLQIERRGVSFKWKEAEEESGSEWETQTSDIWGMAPNSQGMTKSFTSSNDASQHTFTNTLSSYQPSTTYSTQYHKRDGIYTIVPELILYDSRSTLMIRNVPYYFTLHQLAALIDYEFTNCYDFLYLPSRSNGQEHAGFAFINFIALPYLLAFYQRFHCATWPVFNQDPFYCYLSYSRLQGLNSLTDAFEWNKMKKGGRKGGVIVRDLTPVIQLIRSQQMAY